MKGQLRLKELIMHKGLYILIIVQTLLLLYVGMQKEEMHIDEAYSLILSNSYGADRISNASEVWDNWVDGSVFIKFLQVEPGEQFAYDKVFYNNSLDAHPPFFYMILHTVYSFFPGQYTIWLALMINIVCIVLTQILLYQFAKEIMKDPLWALVPVAIYGGTQAFFDTSLFVRMYALLTLLTMLLIRLHYHLIKDLENKKYYLYCFLITFLGVFTQYYFAFVAFYMAVATCIYMMIKKRWKSLFAYGGLMLSAVVSVFIVFPAGITQITGSESNNVGNEVMSNLFNLSGFFRSILRMGYQILVNALSGYLYGIIAIAFFVIVTIIVLRKNKNNKAIVEKNSVLEFDMKQFIVLTAILICTVLTITHVSGSYVYVRYVYNLFPLFSLFVGVVIWLMANSTKVKQDVLAIGLIVIGIIGATSVACNDLCSYLFIAEERADMENVQGFEERPVVFVNKGETYQPTALLNIIMECNQVYFTDYIEAEDVDSIFSQVNCEEGVVFIILTDTYWSDGFDGDVVMQELVEETELFSNYYEYGTCDFSTIYIAETYK